MLNLEPQIVQSRRLQPVCLLPLLHLLDMQLVDFFRAGFAVGRGDVVVFIEILIYAGFSVFSFYLVLISLPVQSSIEEEHWKAGHVRSRPA